jgi:hypothetical protein
LVVPGRLGVGDGLGLGDGLGVGEVVGGGVVRGVVGGAVVLVFVGVGGGVEVWVATAVGEGVTCPCGATMIWFASGWTGFPVRYRSMNACHVFPGSPAP